jgi:hypothetical protein
VSAQVFIKKEDMMSIPKVTFLSLQMNQQNADNLKFHLENAGDSSCHQIFSSFQVDLKVNSRWSKQVHDQPREAS